MKRYLKTPEEVINALQVGKKVETEGLEYKFINGILVGISKTDKNWIIYPALYFSVTPYIDEPKPLKLEVGKFYRTRNGEKAVILAVDENQSFFAAVIGKYNTFFVNDKGLACEKQLNLVAPWEE